MQLELLGPWAQVDLDSAIYVRCVISDESLKPPTSAFPINIKLGTLISASLARLV